MERPELSISVQHTPGSVQHTPGEVELTLVGEIDMLTVARLSALVNELLAEPPARILLDMAGVTFCDSQGLGTLVVLSRKASHAGTVLILTQVGDFLQRVLDITGLRSALMISNGSPTA